MRRIAGLVVLILAACVSRSVFDERFEESSALSAPTVSVSPVDPNHFSFAMVGDTHIGGGDTTRFRSILKGAQSENDSFIVLLGDIVDGGDLSDAQAVQSALSDYGFAGKAIPVIGNHDIFNDGWTAYKEVFGASHYTVDIGNSRFIAMDSADGVIGESQSAWVKSELEKTLPVNTFLISHYMPIVPGQRTYLRLSNELEAERMMKLASSHGVRGWFGGHYHSFAQSKIEGVSYVVAGGGGGRRMEPVKDFFFVQVRVDANQVAFTMNKVD